MRIKGDHVNSSTPGPGPVRLSKGLFPRTGLAKRQPSPFPHCAACRGPGGGCGHGWGVTWSAKGPEEAQPARGTLSGRYEGLWLPIPGFRHLFPALSLPALLFTLSHWQGPLRWGGQGRAARQQGVIITPSRTEVRVKPAFLSGPQALC